MTFDPSIALHFGQGFFLPNLVAIGHSWTISPCLNPVDPCMTFNPSNALHFTVRGSSYEIGGHRAFLKQLDLWMTFDPWSAPYPMPSFSSIPQSTTKPIAVHTPPPTHTHTPLHTYRLCYFSIIDVTHIHWPCRPFSQFALSFVVADSVESEAMCVVNLVQVHYECNPNAPDEKYEDQVYHISPWF